MIIGVVVLAAGKSERMGANKLLLSFDGKTLLEQILDAMAAAGMNDPLIVLGHKPNQIIEAIKPRLHTLKTVVNDDYEQGMTSSFQKGLQMLLQVDAAFLVLGDEPILDPNILKLMMQQMETGKGKTLIVSPIHKGKKGHPLLFHKQLFEEILALKSSQTIRDIVYKYAGQMSTIEAAQWTIMDIDTPEDYALMMAAMKTGNWIL
jgi:molybdenum cofactor cytidylyltransferase